MGSSAALPEAFLAVACWEGKARGLDLWLQEIQAVNGRLRHAFERMQLLRRSRREAKLAQHAEREDVTVSLMADATSMAGSAEPVATAEGQATPRPCFNGGQVGHPPACPR